MNQRYQKIFLANILLSSKCREMMSLLHQDTNKRFGYKYLKDGINKIIMFKQFRTAM